MNKKNTHVQRVSGHELSVAHYTGKITYDARQFSDKNRDFIPPEMVGTFYFTFLLHLRSISICVHRLKHYEHRKMKSTKSFSPMLCRKLAIWPSLLTSQLRKRLFSNRSGALLWLPKNRKQKSWLLCRMANIRRSIRCARGPAFFVQTVWRFWKCCPLAVTAETPISSAAFDQHSIISPEPSMYVRLPFI